MSDVRLNKHRYVCKEDDFEGMETPEEFPLAD